jgi:hypothetical protein
MTNREKKIGLPNEIVIRFGGRDAAFINDWRGESALILKRCLTLIESGDLDAGESLNLFDSSGNVIGHIGAYL